MAEFSAPNEDIWLRRLAKDRDSGIPLNSELLKQLPIRLHYAMLRRVDEPQDTL